MSYVSDLEKQIDTLRAEIARKDAALRPIEPYLEEDIACLLESYCRLDPDTKAPIRSTMSVQEQIAVGIAEVMLEQVRAALSPAAEQEQQPEQKYRDLIPGKDVWQKGDEELISVGWRAIHPGYIGNVVKWSEGCRRPLPCAPKAAQSGNGKAAL